MDNYFSRYIHSALTGDETAYETLYNLTKDALFFAILNITKNDQDAINILKESYTHAFENLSSLDKPEIFEIWLNRIVAYSAYSFLMEKNSTAFSNIVENFVWNDEDNYDRLPQETIDDKDTRNIVKDIIDRLPDDQRLLVIMHYYQEMDISAISNTLDLSENIVMCTLSYARERIKQEISKAESEGKLMRSVSLGAVSYTLTELAKSQFLFHPAPPMSSIISAPSNAVPFVEEKNDIQAILNIPSPSETQPQEQTVQEPQEEYINPYQQQEQTVQEPQEEYVNPYQQQDQTVQEPQEEYVNPYQQQEQAVQESQEEYINPYQQQEQAVQEPQGEYVNPYQQQEQTVQEPQGEYVNPYQQQEQTAQEPQEDYANSYLQRQKQAIQEETHQTQEQTTQEAKAAPARPEPYKRVLESNFSVDNAPKSKKAKKPKTENSSLSKITNFLKSTAGMATIAGIVVVAVGAVLFYYISNAAKNSSLSTDGIVESSYNAPTESEVSHEPTAEELRAAELKDDEKNYVYKKYSNGTLHIVGYNGDLEDIVIPEKYENKMVTGIDPMAFQGCTHIKSVTISKNIQSISLDSFSITFNPFYDCIYMKNIYVDNNNKYFTSVDGVLYNKDKTKLLFYPSYRSEKSYSVLDSVTEIEIGAFQRNGILTSITLPKGLKNIGKEAFYSCTSLKKIEIPSGIKKIDDSLFYNCKSLTDISLPNTITEIGEYAFTHCSALRNITIPKSVKKLKCFAFEQCTMLDTCTVENNDMVFDTSKSAGREEPIFTKTQVTLRAKKGSTAEKYATKWKMYFSAI